MKKIESLVIAGGGTAGWMAAAAFITKFPDLKITLLESEEIGTVGVGESTIPAIRDFNQLIGIDEKNFIRETNASFKLGIEFVNWGDLGESYIHPFGRLGKDFHGMEFHQIWRHLREWQRPDPIDNFAIGAVAARQGKFAYPVTDSNGISGSYNYSYHFDAGLYAKFLRKIAELRGVQRLEGKIESVSQDVSGNITQIHLDSGKSIQGDFFIDCTGFHGLLISKTLSVKFDDWNEWLLCDRAVAVPCASSADFLPLTRATAHSSGWCWRIPLQHRTGNGCVYSSQYMSEDEATSMLLSSVDGALLAEPKSFKFTAGKRAKNWEKNCVAVGLSSGFLEPLESTSIYLIQYAIQKCIELFPNGGNVEPLRNEFNLQLSDEYLRIRDFIIMHYFENRRTDSPFWNRCASMTIPESLKYRQQVFRERGYVDYSQYGVYAAVCIGQGVIPKECSPLLQSIDKAELVRFVNGIRREINAHAETMDSMKSEIEKIKNAVW